MSSNDIEYLRMRAASERAMARAASNAKVAAIHSELAGRYDALLDAAEAGRSTPMTVASEEASQAAPASA